MGKKYLLTLEESSAGNDFMTRHLIEAQSYQHVKYHYHRTLKDWGWHDSAFGKHCLEGPNGLLTEIHSIEPLNDIEWEVLQKHLRNWGKV